jgi:hypothetical protein
MLIPVKMLDFVAVNNHGGILVDAVLDLDQVVRAHAREVPTRGTCTVVYFKGHSQPWEILGPPGQLLARDAASGEGSPP